MRYTAADRGVGVRMQVEGWLLDTYDCIFSMYEGLGYDRKDLSDSKSGVGYGYAHTVSFGIWTEIGALSVYWLEADGDAEIVGKPFGDGLKQSAVRKV